MLFQMKYNVDNIEEISFHQVRSLITQSHLSKPLLNGQNLTSVMYSWKKQTIRVSFEYLFQHTTILDTLILICIIFRMDMQIGTQQ